MTVTTTATVTATVLAVLAATRYLHTSLAHWRRRRGWAAAGRDVVVVHCLRPGFYTPCCSSFAMKLLTYLRLANIPHQMDYEEPMGPRGQCPWITFNGEEYADSQLIIELLADHFGKDFSKHLTEEQRGVCRALTTMVEDHLCWCLREWRFKQDDARNLREGMVNPWYYRLTPVVRLGLRDLNNTLWAVGVGRHRHQQVQHFAKADLRAVAAVLGDKPFLMGAAPCEVDCPVFAQLTNVLHNDRGSPYAAMMIEEFPTLVSYVKRVRARLWPDWDALLDRPAPLPPVAF